MGKRSNFERVDKDFYRTIDKRAGAALAPHLPDRTIYAEPCFGEGDLYNQLKEMGHICEWATDVEKKSELSGIKDALLIRECDLENCEYIITNPPWSREVLHQMIIHFSNMKPTWLLFDASWVHTKQSIPYLNRLKKIVSVGRLKWIPDTTMSGKDDASWYLFDKNSDGIEFHGRIN